MSSHIKKNAGRHILRTIIALLLLALLVGGLYYAVLSHENSLTGKLTKWFATNEPTATPEVTEEPTPEPTEEPTPEPTEEPTEEPTAAPTAEAEATVRVIVHTPEPTKAPEGVTGAPAIAADATGVAVVVDATAAPTVDPNATELPEIVEDTWQPAATPEPVELEFPYYIEVDRGQHVVRVYTVGEDGEYSILARTMICVTDQYGNKPADGLYRMDGQKSRWSSSLAFENHYQYATRIYGKILFHSINYSLQYPDMIKPDYYAMLGTNSSEGSILLLAADAKWIYDNIPAGTPIRYMSSEYDAALIAELAAPALGTSGFDPTDNREDNPDYDPSYEASKPEVTPYPGVTPAPTDGWVFQG